MPRLCDSCYHLGPPPFPQLPQSPKSLLQRTADHAIAATQPNQSNAPTGVKRSSKTPRQPTRPVPSSTRNPRTKLFNERSLQANCNRNRCRCSDQWPLAGEADAQTRWTEFASSSNPRGRL
ncbi:uncharacterized protein BKA78DRAFT_6383 [Phyllosticta capitalensis]|uniref:uncharacterized protein n=1 Tax=Phyllosticta capitalensis TaxID=121624 RepID=UPI003132028A